jgi:beta-glucanase (GH16 family)
MILQNCTNSNKKINNATADNYFPILFKNDSNIKIDGNDKDWPDVIPCIIAEKTQLVAGGRATKEESSGVVKVFFDKDNYYIYARINDNTPGLNYLKHANIWQGDCLELYIGFHEEELQSMQNNDFQLGIPLINNNKDIWLWTKSRDIINHEISVNVDDKGCIIEAKIPFNNFEGISVKPGDKIWIDFSIDNSKTGNERYSQMTWFGTKDNYMNPSLWKKTVITDNQEELNKPYFFASSNFYFGKDYYIYIFNNTKPWQGKLKINNKTFKTDENGVVKNKLEKRENLNIIAKIDNKKIETILNTTYERKKPEKTSRSGELRTKESFLYGRFETRAQLLAVSGVISSFFTFHDNLEKWNELDIEMVGKQLDKIQFNAITLGQAMHEQSVDINFNPYDDYHVYAIDWTPEYVAWLIDGKEVYRQTGKHVKELRYPQKIMMNLWQSSNSSWAGNFDIKSLPLYAMYDYVAYYEYTPNKKQKFSLSWKDHFENWDRKRWSKATHTWDGNNTIFIPQNVVFKDSNLILCLTKKDNPGYNGIVGEE